MDRVAGKVFLPIWLALILFMLFPVLFDGRHLLGTPCH